MAIPQTKKQIEPASEHEVDLSTLESFIGYNLRRANAKQRERFRKTFSRYDIRPVQLTVLVLIRDSMPVRQAVLGRALEMKRANVVTVLDELIKRGLVSRQPADDDRRSNVVTLTASGKKLTDKLLALHQKLEDDLANAFGKRDLARLVKLLQAFRKIDSTPGIE